MTLRPSVVVFLLSSLFGGCRGGGSSSPVPAGTSDTTDSGVMAAEQVPAVAPVFEPERGYYDDALSVAVSSPVDGAEVCLTTDATAPTGAEAPLDGSLEIDGTTVVRAALCQDGALLGPSVTHTYLFRHQVVDQQPPQDYPAYWWTWYTPGGYAADYEMDPEITEAPRNEGAFPAALETLPAVSIVTDPDHLFGEQGIHEHPFYEGVEWERPASFEWLPLEGEEDTQANAGLRLYGGYCRYPEYAKKTFRFLFKREYGPGELEYPFFSDGAVDSFDTLVLRARFDLSWIHGSDTTRDYALYVRDQLARELQVAMGSLSTHGRHVHVYLNGLYWGVYVLHERSDAHFTAAYLGGEEEDWDVLNAGEAVDGDREAWEEAMAIAQGGLQSDEAYTAFQEYVDVENLADYLLLNAWLGNYEWPNHNWYAARRRQEGAGWIFFSWDAEAILSELSVDLTNADYEDSPGRLYQYLLENASFRDLMTERIEHHMFDDGVLTTQAVTGRWEALVDTVEPAMVAESARWGDSRRDVYGDADELYTYHDHWLEERRRLEEDYLPHRADRVLQQYEALGLYRGE